MDLSPRQVQILTLIAEGGQDKDIAQQLGMSARTVDSHLQRLYTRYRIHTRAALVAKWLLEGGRPALIDAEAGPEVSDAEALGPPDGKERTQERMNRVSREP